MSVETPRIDGELAPSFRVGDRLGPYQLVMPLASGGMGVVFVARVVGGARLVAIKTLRPSTSEHDHAALLQEARLTAKLAHPNVVATLDLGAVDEVPYVVMELVAGVPFAALLDATRAASQHLSPELGAWIVMQAALGLHAAHELTGDAGQPLGLVHRDVSPHNILLSMDGAVKIADFGIAKFDGRDDATASGMIKGKFSYMSPEQTRAQRLDRRSDVFALGAVLWEALVGERLFLAKSPARTLLKVMELTADPPSVRRPEVSDALSAITLRCLEKSPEARYPTAAALAEDLRAALREGDVHADERDLQRLLARHFGEPHAAWLERLRNAAGI